VRPRGALLVAAWIVIVALGIAAWLAGVPGVVVVVGGALAAAAAAWWTARGPRPPAPR
jgi:hypothetical protein